MLRSIVIAVVGASMVAMAFGLAKPDLLLSFIGFSIADPALAADQLGEVRAVYGGLFAVIGVFTLLSAIDPVASRTRLVVLGWCCWGSGADGLWAPWSMVISACAAGVHDPHKRCSPAPKGS